MDLSTLVFADNSPWPSIEVVSQNQRYAAAMLSNIGACNSEMSAISLYVYNSIITKNYFFDIAECFHRISIVEMHHLNIFGELSIMLGADPRLWSYQNGRMRYWSPACNRYPTRIGALVTNALNGELEAIKKYQAQAQWIDDFNIKAILNRIIADELCHVEIFRFILAELNQDSFIQSAELRGNDEFPEGAERDENPEGDERDENPEAAGDAKAAKDTNGGDDGADTIKTVGSFETVDSFDTVDSLNTVDSLDAVDSFETIDSNDTVNSIEAVNGAETNDVIVSIDNTDATNDAETIDSSEAIGAVDTINIADTINTDNTVNAAEIIGTDEITDTSEFTDAAEIIEADEIINATEFTDSASAINAADTIIVSDTTTDDSTNAYDTINTDEAITPSDFTDTAVNSSDLT